MKKMIKFPSIEQFRTVISNINRHYNFVGLDDNGEAIYDPTLPKPTIAFKGTVKIHGTNAAVSYNAPSGMWAQSRENIITPEKDNAGFAFFAHSHEVEFMRLFHDVAVNENIDTHKNTITIYGEWAGANIQKGVGVTNLPKSFFIFGVKITPHTETEEELKANPAYWVDYSYLKDNDAKIYNIDDFSTHSIDIDFNMPQLVQNQLSELTIAVEEECPVAKHFGFSVLENNTAYEDENGNIWFENESLPNFTNPIKDKLKSIFKEKRLKSPNGVNFIKFSLK